MNIIILTLASAALSFTPPLHAGINEKEALARLVTASFDLNADTYLDAGEWQAGVRAIFDELDRDHDGHITAKEMGALTQPLGDDCHDLITGIVCIQVRGFVLGMDADKDNSVSEQEFTRHTEAIYKQLDRNLDATVDQAELSRLPAQLSGREH